MRRAPFLVIFIIFVSCLLMGATIGCPFLGDSEGDGGESDDGSGGGAGGTVTRRERDVSGKLVVAIGGMDEGSDEIVIDESFTTLELQNGDPDLFEIKPRPGFSTIPKGRGGRIVARRPGIGYVTPIVNGRSRQPVEVTIPPQSLVQILVGEARGQLAREATLDAGGEGGGGRVKTSSVSVTGEALGAVIRNRIDLINNENSPSLFLASSEDYGRDPPASYYDAVIAANDGLIYQFSPVDPGDPSNEAFKEAERRIDVEAGRLTAYDQAVLTAGPVFNGDAFQEGDPTGGAFAFYSPTGEEYEALQSGLDSGSQDLPAGCGTSDENFPAFAPVQVVILPEVATVSTGDSARPSFVFVRQKGILEPAITDVP